jgi:hypothetical protein
MVAAAVCLAVLLATQTSQSPTSSPSWPSSPDGTPFAALRRDDHGTSVGVTEAGRIVALDADGVVLSERAPWPTPVSFGSRRRGLHLRLDDATRLMRNGYRLPGRIFLGDAHVLRAAATDLLSFPYGTTGEPYLELAPDSPAFWGVVRSMVQFTWQLRDDASGADESNGRSAGDADTDAMVSPDGEGPSVGGLARRRDQERARAVCQSGPDDDVTLGDLARKYQQTLADMSGLTARSAWTSMLPRIDVGLGTVVFDSQAVLVATFLNGVERSQPADFVDRTLQGHVTDQQNATLDRNRQSSLPYVVVALSIPLEPRFDHEARRRFERTSAIIDAEWRRTTALLAERKRLCAGPNFKSPNASLRLQEIAALLAPISPAWVTVSTSAS